jgi:hypothetical protein
MEEEEDPTSGYIKYRFLPTTTTVAKQKTPRTSFFGNPQRKEISTNRIQSSRL